eukprot:CAMPEP_0201477230 /NCGR_PEP_ID=MMETSP0151_2-20130828/2289_1 /ASSEMBLY_ACC=CAM_ASM_000257 /TAXON_ID=200890 /ORGANISM="Paramoeba atlantica, Strain 621/1 / CCAP 1560/9" /LENGTH=917 /DNA_ID=CAMNT_0047857871 /DNA_START=24 /DNA_END=2777 /DNA_ORIENTATION=+
MESSSLMVLNKWGLHYRSSSVSSLLQYFSSSEFPPIYAVPRDEQQREEETRGIEKNAVAEEAQFSFLLRRCKNHYLSLAGGSAMIDQDFFVTVASVLRPGAGSGALENVANRLRTSVSEWFSKNADTLVPGSYLKKYRDFVQMDWHHFIYQLQNTSSYPVTALHLQAIADVTSCRVFVITCAEERDEYILDVSPSKKEETGAICLGLWAASKWVPLEKDRTKDICVTSETELAVLEQAENLVQLLNSLTPHQMTDLKLSKPLVSALDEWTKSRSDIEYSRATRVFMFGYGGDYALGQNNSHSYTLPKVLDTNPEFVGEDFEKIPIMGMSLGVSHSIFLREDGRVYTVGSNAYRQLGIPEKNPHSVSEHTEIRELKATHVACGGYHTVVATQAHGLYSFGYGNYGQRGDGTYEKAVSKMRLLRFPERGRQVIQVECGEMHTACLISTGELYTFGDNKYWQLGVGWKVKYKNTPTLVETLSGVKKIACGSFHMLASTSKGEIFAWGPGEDGRLGLRTVLNQTLPQSIPTLAGKDIADIACGDRHSIAIDTSSQVWVWGRNASYQLGLGDSKSRLVPTALTGLPVMTKVSCGYSSTYGVSVDGDLYSWGDNSSGQLGHGDKDIRKVPEKVKSFEKCVRDVAASKNHVGVIASKYGNSSANTNMERNLRTVQPVAGFHILYAPHVSRGDIIFVSSSLQDWVGKDGSLWPRDWLSSDLAEFRIIAVETEAIEEKKWKSFEDFQNQGTIFCHVLKDEPFNIGKSHQPVIWVGHSLSGLIVKEILLEAEVEAPSLFTSSRLAIFFSTPHTNERYATYAMRLSAKNKSISLTKKDMEQLIASYERFGKLQHIFTLSLGESESLDLSYVHSFRGKFSATDANPNYRGSRHRFIALPGNHFTIAQPSSPLSVSYKTILEEISRRIDA